MTCGVPRRQCGFSLLEVIVAFAVLALTLGILMQVFARALSTTALSGDYSRAVTLAEARLNAVGVDIPLEPGGYTGEPEDGLSWNVLIEPYQGEDLSRESALYPYLVRSEVSWSSGSDGHRQVSLSTIRLAISGEAESPDSGTADELKESGSKGAPLRH